MNKEYVPPIITGLFSVFTIAFTKVFAKFRRRSRTSVKKIEEEVVIETKVVTTIKRIQTTTYSKE